MPSIIEEHSSRLPEESLLSQPDQSYQVEANLVDLSDLMRGAVGVMEKRLADEDVDLEISLPTPAPQVLADRIILRQVLFSLFKYVLHMLSGKTIQITLEAKGLLRFNFQVDANWSFWREEEYDDLLKSVHSWSERLEVGLRESYPAYGQDGQAEIILEFGTPSRRTVLVVDDQPAALRMFERYLSRSGYEVVGVSDPSQVQILAKQLKPALITLDVMMPRLDGWEVMQALKLDEDTRSIPVVVCSAWEEPELAHSLGAAGFLKKPVTQKDLLGMIDQITRL